MNGSAKYLSVKAILAGAALAFFTLMAMAQSVSPLNLPLYFEANKSQSEFLSSGGGYQFQISSLGAQIALRDSGARPAMAQIRFIGANTQAQIQGGGKLPGKVNYLIGNDSSQWQTGLPTFGNVQITGIYPGINLVFHGNQRQLEYDFTIASGANPNVIKVHFDGVDKIALSPQGDLVLKIGTGEIRQPEPEIYQAVAGARKDLSGGYRILDRQTVAFNVGPYDHSLPLVIDPVLGYSTFFGGNTSATGWAIAMDANTNLYIAGQTFSKQFFTTNAYQTNFGGGTYVGDAFVAKFGNPATNLIYLTYLGGSGDDAAYGLAVDGNGDAYITGATESANFPTNNAIPGHGTIGGKVGPTGLYPADAFVTELGPGGSKLIYSTFLGGADSDAAYGIALDSSTNAYVTGFTFSTNFPVSANAILTHLACSNNFYLNANAFVSEITNGGGALIYSTYLGGTNYDVGRGIAVDAANNVYVAGYTASFNFPVWNTPTNLPYGRYLNGVTNQRSIHYTFDGFAAKFPPLNGTIPPSTQTNTFYSTFLGGTNDDMAYGIVPDSSGNAYVTGWTASTNFPHMNNPPGLYSFLITNGVPSPIATNVFLTKISADGSNVLDSAVFGGRGVDIGYGVAVDSVGDAFVVGGEASTNFPAINTFGTLSPTNSGGYDAFVTGFSANWSNVYYSVDIGGKHNDFGYGITLDSSTNVYITGSTDSTNYPTLNAGRFWFNGTNFINGNNYINGTSFSGTNDAFLTQIIFAPAAPTVAIQPTNQTIGQGATIAIFSAIVSGAGQFTYQWQTNGVNLTNGTNYIGVTTSTLTITNAHLENSCSNYDVVVSYGDGSITASNANLLVLPWPFIITAPTNQTVMVGSNVSFTVVANGAPLLYAWSTNQSTVIPNGGRISGATNSTLTISDVQPSDAGTYWVYVGNGANSTNVSATLTVLTFPPQITVPPANQTVGVGSTVTFAITATGGTPLFYHWQTNGVNLTNGGQFSGVTTNTLTITNVQPANSGTYTIVVTNSFGSVSTNALLTVLTSPRFIIPAPNSNGTVLSGSGGTNGGTYYALVSSNLLTPLNLWTPIVTNQFGSQGQFAFTNIVETNLPELFYILKEP